MKFRLSWIPLFATAVLAQTDYSTWAHYRDIVVNPMAAGGITTTERNYPLLLRFTTAGGNGAGALDFSQAMANGEDVRFQALPNDVPQPAVSARRDLPYEIERWSSGAAEIWVRVDTLHAGHGTRIRMYWGKTGSAAAGSGSAVFNSAVNAFRGVLHFNNSLANSTDVSFTPVDNGSTNAASGAVGQGRAFDGASNSVDLGPASILNSAQPHSMGAWVNASSLNYGSASNSWRNIISHGNGQAADHEVLRSQYAADGSSYWSFGYWDGSVNYFSQAEVVNADEQNTWVYVAGAFDGANFTLYRNGVAQTAMPMGGLPLVDSDQNWFLSQHGASAGRHFSGVMDEVRLASAARSASWFKWDYETQKANPTAVAYGAIDVATGLRAAASGGSAFPLRFGGARLSLNAPGVAFASVRLSVRDAAGRRLWERVLSSEALARDAAWDARAADGTALSAGVYVLRADFLDAKDQRVATSAKTFALQP